MANIDLEMLLGQALARKRNPMGRVLGYLRDNSPTHTLSDAFKNLSWPRRRVRMPGDDRAARGEEESASQDEKMQAAINALPAMCAATSEVEHAV